MGGGMQAGSFTVRYHLLHGGRMPYVVSYFFMLTTYTVSLEDIPTVFSLFVFLLRIV